MTLFSILSLRRFASLTGLIYFLIVSSTSHAKASEQPDAQEVASAHVASVFPADTVRADLSYLYDTLKSAHFNLFAHRAQPEYDRYFQKLIESVTGPVSRLDAIKLYMAFVAYGNVGHAKIDFPVPQYVDYLQGGGTLIPLDIRIDGDRILVAHSYVRNSGLAIGDELVAINGRSAAYWLNRATMFVSAERPYMAYAQLESMFPRIMWLVDGQQDSYDITVRTPDGDRTVMLKAVPVMQIEEYKATLEGVFYKREALMLSPEIAYLRPGPFYATDDIGHLAGFESFIRDAFTAFIENGAEELILDLRNNPGGDNSFSDPMLTWIADKPFHFASRYELKASPQTRTVLADLAVQYPYGISAQMAKRIKEHANGEIFEFEIPENAARSKGFTGRVWALVDRHTYSNATTVAAIIQDYEFGIVVGEETSDLPTSYASSAQFTLPLTNISVTYPKAYFVRPSGDESLQGVVPDRLIEVSMVDELTARADQWDLVLETLLTMIRKEREDS